ncbi:MAG: hypothetical protein MPJ05_04920 [Nitrosopumilus sp.]|nr:hypothetical protein [Nitrosopumilus sp.]
MEKISKYVVYTTEGVVIELRRKDLEKGIEKLLDRNVVSIIMNVKIHKEIKNKGFGLGESELISVALQSKDDKSEDDVIVTSDEAAIEFMKEQGIRYMNVFDFIVWCHKDGLISRESTIDAYDILEKNMHPYYHERESKRAEFISRLD